MKTFYSPCDYENYILEKWNTEKVFLSKNFEKNSTKKSFTVPMPPPNVTGQLHLGHAMMIVVQDIMTRFHRMQGDESLWFPGTDHAAIATESVVLKNLGVSSRENFTRENFIKKCFDHTSKTHENITNQIKKMGASCDFSRERYTMDLGLSNAVWKIFKDLHEKDLIVKGHRMINWSTKAQSVLADDELEYEDQKDTFCYIKCGKFVMGTVRSETKCADSPLVIHPDENYVTAKFTNTKGQTEEFIFSEILYNNEERRRKFFNYLDEHGKWEKISVSKGQNFEGEKFTSDTYAGVRNFFVLCDSEVIDIKKGTGAMTISVCHSADDYLLAKKYPKKLKNYYFEKIGFDGKMTDLAGSLLGEEVKIARKKSVKLMLEKDLIVGLEKNYVHNVPLCYRTGCIVEPMISPQWFIDVNKKFDWQEGEGAVNLVENKQSVKKSLKELTLESIKDHGGDIDLIPNRFVKTYDQWIDNLQDWCISRQIWWGHQIPVWYDENNKIYSAHEQKILFVRHGESENNLHDIVGGNSSLTKKGEENAKNIADNLLKKGISISKIYFSSLKRSKQTAEIIKSILVKNNYDVKIEFFEDFHEIELGNLENTKRDKSYKNTFYKMRDENTGESLENIEKRANKFWKNLNNKGSEKESILFVGHRTFTSHIFAVKNGCKKRSLIDYRDRWTFDHEEVKEIIWMMKPKSDKNLRQDNDTLDTWFSSALWPFSSLGWPDKTLDFKNFFPTSVLETGHDILFFWVARMIMFSKFALGKSPFSKVYLHGLVCDEKGKKMSKSKGNGIDPLDMIEKYGTDALRMSLIVGTTPGNQVNLGEKKIEGYRNFINKIWNISRYIFSLPKINENFDINIISLPEKWILSRAQTLVEEVTNGLENDLYGEVGQKLYDFAWNDLASWAIESSKVVESKTVGVTLFMVLKTLLKLLHPYTPFITETLWKEMGKKTLLSIEKFPKIEDKYRNLESEKDFQILQNIVKKIRSIRSESKVNPTKKIHVVLNGKNINLLKDNKEMIILLSRLESLEFNKNIESECIKSTTNNIEILIPVNEMIDMEEEIRRKNKEIENLKNLKITLEKKLENKKYIENAPSHLVEKTKSNYLDVIEKLKLLEK
jgi:valyl-tRNA synthetase